ncbi:MAG TPA: class I SAM-dependent methyltransferase [Allocoleopsis sp.]
MLSSLERIIPDLINNDLLEERETLELHLNRYDFAGKNLKPGVVIDIACGVGYGSYFLAYKYQKKITTLYGIDIDDESIAFAKKRYHLPIIKFCCSDAFTFQMHEMPDTIVSMETIEHLENPERFVLHFAKRLKKGGRFIASAPVTPSMDANPYHLHDFTAKSFKKLFKSAGLKEVCSFVQYQKFNPFKLFRKKEQSGRALRKNIAIYYFRNPHKFFIRIRSTIMNGFTNKYLLVVFEKE